jgi:excisionase family DNA binding protein
MASQNPAFMAGKAEATPASPAWGNSQILTKQQAAEYLQVTPRYIERMVSSGRLRAFKPTGKLWRARLSDLTAFLDSGATIGGAE